ncbi:MAG: hypothetical protein ACOZQL_32280 [Myxococcota bacterium]
MKPSTMLGLAAGWAAMCVFNAVDTGPGDPLFLPSLVLAVPGAIGAGAAVVTWRRAKPPQRLDGVRVTGMMVLGAVLAMVAALVIIAALAPKNG